MDFDKNIDWPRIFSLLNITGADIQGNVRNTDIYEYAKKVSNLLMAKDKAVSQEWPFNETWVDMMANHENPQIAKKFRIWLSVGLIRQRTIYLFYLANVNYRSARFFLETLAYSKQPVPDLEYFLNNIISMFFDSCPPPRIDIVFTGEENYKSDPGALKIRKFLESRENINSFLNDPEVNIPVMGGWRNVLLGSHTGEFDDFQSWEDSVEYFDLGGGHHTPWLSNEVKRNITCLDLIRPNDLNHVKIRKIRYNFDGQKFPSDLEGAELSEYLEKLDQQSFSYFNLLEDEFPFREKLTIFSTGFLTSTMPLPQNLLDLYSSIYNTKMTVMQQSRAFNFVGIIKCLRLVQQGADLELITASRPSAYPMKHRIVQLRWIDGELVCKKVSKHDNTRFSLDIKHRRRKLISGIISG
jgi:hypothetical protein